MTLSLEGAVDHALHEIARSAIGLHGIRAVQTSVVNKGLRVDQEQWSPHQVVEEHSVLIYTRHSNVTAVHRLTVKWVFGHFGVGVVLTNADNKGPKIDQERWYPPKIVEEHSVLTSKKRGIATELRQLVAS